MDLVRLVELCDVSLKLGCDVMVVRTSITCAACIFSGMCGDDIVTVLSA